MVTTTVQTNTEAGPRSPAIAPSEVAIRSAAPREMTNADFQVTVRASPGCARAGGGPERVVLMMFLLCAGKGAD